MRGWPRLLVNIDVAFGHACQIKLIWMLMMMLRRVNPMAQMVRPLR
jgi:hypothetical protein